jgi:DNA-binding winged helix-turn-helix (wHTH) protein
MGPRCFSFGPFVLIPERQLLLKEGSPVRVGARALEILTVLVERSGQLLNKQEIISSVWTDTFVDESNLKVNIAAIRKAIDPSDSKLSCIVTVIGRGYRFVEPVTIAAMGAEISLWNVYPERKSMVDQQSAGFSDSLLSSA